MKNIFINLIKKNKLAHAYLFFSFNRNVLLDFSQWLASELEPNKKILLDFFSIKPEKKTIGIDQARTVKNFLWQKPIQSSKKMVVIEDAECLTVEAQNAILKIVEEPPAHALIVLLVKSHELLLPTVVSRFQKIYLSEKIQDQNSSEEIKKIISDFFKGNSFQRSKIIQIALEKEILTDFVNGLIIKLSENKLKNWRLLKELFYRWQLMNQLNLNKRLQLEAFSQLLN
jgi:hypothetical protein